MATALLPTTATLSTSITRPEPRDSYPTSLCGNRHEFSKAANSPKYCSTRCQKEAAKARSKVAKPPPTMGRASQATEDGRNGRKDMHTMVGIANGKQLFQLL